MTVSSFSKLHLSSTNYTFWRIASVHYPTKNILVDRWWRHRIVSHRHSEYERERILENRDPMRATLLFLSQFLRHSYRLHCWSVGWVIPVLAQQILMMNVNLSLMEEVMRSWGNSLETIWMRWCGGGVGALKICRKLVALLQMRRTEEILTHLPATSISCLHCSPLVSSSPLRSLLFLSSWLLGLTHLDLDYHSEKYCFF